MNDEPSLFYEFGPFRLNVQERLLEKDSELVQLTPKVFETLLVLVEHRGHVLAKDDLMSRLWPDTFVEESSLTQNISLLRRALDEAPGSRQYIETIPKRGYRFVADVRRLSVESQETTTQQSISTELMIAAQIEEEVSEVPAPVAPLTHITPASIIRRRFWQSRRSCWLPAWSSPLCAIAAAPSARVPRRPALRSSPSGRSATRTRQKCSGWGWLTL